MKTGFVKGKAGFWGLLLGLSSSAAFAAAIGLSISQSVFTNNYVGQIASSITNLMPGMKRLLKFSLIPLLLHTLTSQGALTVTNIAPGSNARDSLFVESDGSLWAMGWNPYGGLGDGTSSNANQPEQIVSSNVTAIATGRGHSLFIKGDGSLWAMGWNIAGQLGDGTYNSPINVPEQILSSNVTAIAAGFGHSLFIKGGGSLHVMGYNAPGQLGDGTFNSTNVPEKIVAGNVRAIAGGEGRSLFLKSDGSLWAMGDNTYGELGDGFATNGIAVPEQVFPATQPLLSIALSSQTNVQINATCDFGGNFYLLGSTNVALPLSQWTPLRTNSVTLRGLDNYATILTNVVTAGGRQFYILQSQ